MKRQHMLRVCVAILTLWVVGHGSVVVSAPDHSQLPQELIGTWVGSDVSMVLSEDGAGQLNYNPPGPYPACQKYRDGLFIIEQWSLTRRNIKIKIKQMSEVRYNDGRIYRLKAKAWYQSPWLTLELWDANHTKAIILTRRDRTQDIMDGSQVPIPSPGR